MNRRMCTQGVHDTGSGAESSGMVTVCVSKYAAQTEWSSAEGRSLMSISQAAVHMVASGGTSATYGRTDVRLMV
jgi:hypothetical protein